NERQERRSLRLSGWAGARRCCATMAEGSSARDRVPHPWRPRLRRRAQLAVRRLVRNTRDFGRIVRLPERSGPDRSAGSAHAQCVRWSRRVAHRAAARWPQVRARVSPLSRIAAVAATPAFSKGVSSARGRGLDSYDVYFSFALAAAAGLLIGIEREQSAARDEDAGRSPAFFSPRRPIRS